MNRALKIVVSLSLMGLIFSCTSATESEVRDNRTLKPVNFSNGSVVGTEDESTDTEGPGISTNPGSQNTAGCPNAVDLPDVSPDSGQLLLNLASTTIDPCSVTGFVVGQQGSFALLPTKTSRYFVDGLTQGTYDVIIMASSLGLQDASQGTRINDIRVENGNRADRPGVAIGALGSITGTVMLADAETGTPEGTRVYIPGTGYEAIADANGAFEITGAPPGTHDLRYEKLNYRPSALGAVVVPNGGNVIADPVELLIQNGEVTPLFVPGSEFSFNTREIEYFLFPAGTPELMRVSDNPLFANQVDTPFRTSGTFIFPLDEQLRNGGAATRTLYVKVQDDATDTLLSKEIRIDFFGDIRGREGIVTPASTMVTGSLDIEVAIVRPAAATAYRISTKDGVFGEWIAFEAGNGDPVETTVSAAGEGLATVFVQFQTAEGAISPLYTADVNIAIFPEDVIFSVESTTVDGVYRPDFSLVDIRHGLAESEGKLLVSTADDFSNAAEYAAVDALDYTLPEACGQHTIYLKAIHLATGIESLPATAAVNHRCLINLSAQGLNGNALPVRSGGLYYRDRYYHVGGQDDRLFDTRQGYYFDFMSERWRLMTEIGAPKPRRYADMFGFHGKVILFDDFRQNFDNNFNPDGGIYDPLADTWEPIPAIHDSIEGFPETIGSSSSDNRGRDRPFLIGDTLHWVFANSNDSKDFGHYVYHLKKGEWYVPETKPITSSNNLNDHIIRGGPYLFKFGGSPGDDAVGQAKVRDHWYYDYRSNLWNKMNTKDQPSFRHQPIMTWTGDKFFVWGGFQDGDNLVDGSLFDPVANTWTKITAAPDGRDADTNFMVEVHQNRVFIFGGNSRTTGNVVWYGLIYDIAADSWGRMSTDNIPKRGAAFQTRRIGDEVYFYVQEDEDFLPENNIKIYNLDTNQWRDSVVTSDNLQGELLANRNDSFAGSSAGRFLHFGRRAYDSAERDFAFVNDGFLSFEQKSPLVLVNFEIDNSSALYVQKGSSHNIQVTYRNRQLPLANVATEISVISGPAGISNARVDAPSIAANSETVIEGFQIEVDDRAQTGDLIEVRVDYVSGPYAGSETLELVVDGSRVAQAGWARQPDEAAVLGDTVTITVPFVNISGAELTAAPTVALIARHCMDAANLVSGFDGGWAAGATESIEISAKVAQSGCRHGERASFEIELADAGRVITRTAVNFVVGLKTYRTAPLNSEDPLAGYVKFDDDLDSDDNTLISFDITVGPGESIYDFSGTMTALQSVNNRNRIRITTDAALDLLGEEELPMLSNVIADQVEFAEGEAPETPSSSEDDPIFYEYQLRGHFSARTYKEFNTFNDGLEDTSSSESGLRSDSGLAFYNELIGQDGAGVWTITPTPELFSGDFLEMDFSEFEFVIQTLVPEP